MRRIWLTISACLIALGAIALMPAAANASHVNHSLKKTVQGSYCWLTGVATYHCNWETGTSGDTLQNRPYFALGAAQTFTAFSQECGTIGPGCAPFTSGSGLNTDYNGDYILELKNGSSGDCMDITSGNQKPHEGSCSGSNGEVLVAGTGSPFPLISVDVSNYWYAQTGNKDHAFAEDGCNDGGTSCTLDNVELYTGAADQSFYFATG